MRYMIIAALAVMIWSVVPANAEEEKVKGVDMVPDTAVTVLRKVNAFFTGNLTWTMPPGKEEYRNDYTFDPQGRRIPRATLGKYDDGVR